MAGSAADCSPPACLLQVGTSMGCLRRFVLEERLQGSDMGTAALLGTLMHTLFQVTPTPTPTIQSEEHSSI